MGKILFIYEGDHVTWTASVHQFELQEKLKILIYSVCCKRDIHQVNSFISQIQKQWIKKHFLVILSACCHTNKGMLYLSFLTTLWTKNVEKQTFWGWSVLPQTGEKNYRRTKTDFFMLALQRTKPHAPFFIK